MDLSPATHQCIRRFFFWNVRGKWEHSWWSGFLFSYQFMHSQWPPSSSWFRSWPSLKFMTTSHHWWQFIFPLVRHFSKFMYPVNSVIGNSAWRQISSSMLVFFWGGKGKFHMAPSGWVALTLDFLVECLNVTMRAFYEKSSWFEVQLEAQCNPWSFSFTIVC